MEYILAFDQGTTSSRDILFHKKGQIHSTAKKEFEEMFRDKTGLMLDARVSIEIAEDVAELLAQELGLDKAWINNQTQQYTELANGYLLNP